MVKAKVFPAHDMKGKGNRGMAPLILKLGTRWKWVVNFTPRPHYSRVPIDLEAGWAPEPDWTFRRRKLLAPSEIQTPDPPARRWWLYRLRYSGSIINNKTTKSDIKKWWRQKISAKSNNQNLEARIQSNNIYDTTFSHKQLTLIPQFWERALLWLKAISSFKSCQHFIPIECNTYKEQNL